jgi:hypothetical protein
MAFSQGSNLGGSTWMAKPADGSDMLATAQIHWHRTTSVAQDIRAPRDNAGYVRLIRFSFLILIGCFCHP